MTERPTFDAALAAWATAEPAGAGDDAALARILAHAETIASEPAPATRRPGGGFLPKPGWMLGGALAASLAIAFLAAPRPGAAPAGGEAQVVLAKADGADRNPVMLAEADSSESAAFALLYTPTVEEEYQL
jgi:hypothetical protein